MAWCGATGRSEPLRPPGPRGAIFSPDRRYRYALWRVWDRSRPGVTFIGLNPSTADAATDDPTVRRCLAFAERWGAGAVIVLNLFAYRATHPAEMLAALDPIGPRNDAILRRYGRSTPLVVAAWGRHGGHLDRARCVERLLGRTLHALAFTRGGEPRHPLYLRGDLRPRVWRRGEAGAS